MPQRICIIPGDGIGQEVIPQAVKVLDSLKLGFEFIQAEAGFDCFLRTGDSVPADTLEKVYSCQATLFGAVSSPSTRVEGYRSTIVTLRKTLDLFANLRPVQSFPITASRPNIDLMIVRENTEGLYSGRECEMDDGDTAIAERVITRRGSQRIVELAFKLASRRKKHVTLVHKANVLPLTCGLFRSIGLEVAKRYPDVRCDELLVDTMAMRLIKDPEYFDVIVTTNLFGDILSDEASQLVGGLGLAASGNIGTTTAIFEPVHGSAPDIVGKNTANPLATILASSMMLEYLNHPAESQKLQKVVQETILTKNVTPDLGGSLTTSQVADHVIQILKG
jgi:homoisocitrate dehydrogenase